MYNIHHTVVSVLEVSTVDHRRHIFSFDRSIFLNEKWYKQTHTHVHTHMCPPPPFWLRKTVKSLLKQGLFSIFGFTLCSWDWCGDRFLICTIKMTVLCSLSLFLVYFLWLLLLFCRISHSTACPFQIKSNVYRGQNLYRMTKNDKKIFCLEGFAICTVMTPFVLKPLNWLRKTLKK